MEKRRVLIGFSEFSMRGRRYEMEDAHKVIPKFRSASEFYTGVFDGHYNELVANLASCKLHDFLKESLETNHPRKALIKAFLKTDNMAKSKQLDGGSAAVVAYANRNKLFVANAGDARAVLDRAGKAKRLTVDHKAKNKNEQRRINRLGGYITPESANDVARVNGKLAIARSLGDHFFDYPYKDFDLITARPNVREIELVKGDSALILACDGVWDVLSDRQAIEIVSKGKGSSTSQAEILVNEAFEKGSQDNITAVVINLKP